MQTKLQLPFIIFCFFCLGWSGVNVQAEVSSVKLYRYNLVEANTYSGDSGFDVSSDVSILRLWDGGTSAGINDNKATGDVEAWVEFDFGKEEEIGEARLFEDNGGNQVTHWKVQYWSGSSWVDIFPYVESNTNGWQTQTFAVKTSKVRFYAKCTITGSCVSIHELELYTKPSPIRKKTVIGCVGDSNTEGAASSDKSFYAWPIQLGKILGKEYQVRNFGRSGATLFREGDQPWTATNQYTLHKNLNPDISIIALGTNDSKDKNWKVIANSSETFRNDYLNLIREFQSYSSNQEIYMLMPIKAYTGNKFGILDEVIKDEIIPIIREISKTYGIAVIDGYRATENIPHLMADGIHPNDEGLGIIAEKVQSILQTPKPVIITQGTPSTIAYAEYRWYKNDVLISGASDPTYIAPQPGVYKVAVKLNADTDDVIVSNNFEVSETNVELFIEEPKALNNLPAEDGSNLWLRFEGGAQATITKSDNAIGTTALIAMEELQENWKGTTVRLTLNENPTNLKDGYKINTAATEITISADEEIGLLYGAYHLLRLQQTDADMSSLDIEETPYYQHRMLNHWDNLSGTIERGYAGRSIWKWPELPSVISSRYKMYARANASVGINATVLNNVNSTADILKTEYLNKIKVLADEFRPYGIKVYLSLYFTSPMRLGGLSTADPLNQDVINWWTSKINEIYTLIPDFGGFLVKANSEGQPGPQDYGRTHADGANMLAKILEPYNGLVIWRAFVYGNQSAERSAQAYLEFKPLDGKFDDNVVIQIKNGPLDFQPHEPFSPLFGAMEDTKLGLEIQITQEYLGAANHLVYLAPMWKEVLESDTYQDGEGSTVLKKISESSVIAGVANIGEDANWCGHDFAQANWYAFGRLAWNPYLSSEEIAKEWIAQTFCTDPSFVDTVSKLMLDSWPAAVNYMTPLGLNFLASTGHHYGPLPWSRNNFHKAGALTIGVLRDAGVTQYNEPLKSKFGSIETCPEENLLWFHAVSWDRVMKNGRTLWDALCLKYEEGVNQAAGFRNTWKEVKAYVDYNRFNNVLEKLELQAEEAIWWKNACLLNFQSYHKKPFPEDVTEPVYSLDVLKSVSFSTNSIFGCPSVSEVYENVISKKIQPTNDIDYTHLIINNDFDLAPDAECNPVIVTANMDGWYNNAWRPTRSSCPSKQFYGWTHDTSVLGTSESQGINADGGSSKHGSWACWVGGNADGSEEREIELYQIIDKEDLPAGTYRVQCLLAVGSSAHKKFNQRFFANNRVQYFGTSGAYVNNLVDDGSEDYSFAGYTEYSETQMKEMKIYINIGENDSLRLGIRTSNKNVSGAITTQQSPMFRTDYFRLTKIHPDDAADATLSNITLGIGTLDFSPEITTYNVQLPENTTSVTPVATPSIADVKIEGCETVDLSTGSGVSYIKVTALDGITTKTYTIQYTVHSTQIDEVAGTKVIWTVVDGKLVVKGVDAYTVYNVNGMKIAGTNGPETSVHLIPGVYIVKAKSTQPFKIVVY